MDSFLSAAEHRAHSPRQERQVRIDCWLCREDESTSAKWEPVTAVGVSTLVLYILVTIGVHYKSRHSWHNKSNLCTLLMPLLLVPNCSCFVLWGMQLQLLDLETCTWQVCPTECSIFRSPSRRLLSVIDHLLRTLRRRLLPASVRLHLPRIRLCMLCLPMQVTVGLL